MGTKTMYVRLKPYNPKKGFTARRYHYKGRLYAHHNETGRPIAYMVDNPDLLDELEALTQDGTPEGKPLFDILTEEQYGKTTKREDDLRLVELGLASDATVEPVVSIPPVDRTTKSGRAAAVPEEDVGTPGPLDDSPPDDGVKEVEEPKPAAKPKKRGRKPKKTK